MPEWNGKTMVLILDHINVVSNDHRRENLRLVCPNCNSQLSTHCGKNIVKKKYYCSCGEERYKTSLLCIKCSGLARRKVNRPSKEVLRIELKESSFSAIGRKYGVSDNAIRKWCKTYNLVV